MAVIIKKKQASSAKVSAPAWLKRGAAKKEALEKEEAMAIKRKEERGAVRRFWMREEEETSITFLDGDLDEHGLVDCPVWLEHTVRVAGKWDNFCCVSEKEPCPICAMPKQYYTLVGGLTIIDHSKFEGRDGTVYQNQLKLFVAKQGSLSQLRKHAKANGGSLAGCTFEVSRTNDKAARVGDVFIFQEKHTLAQLKKKYETKEQIIQPLNYEEEVRYRTAEELKLFGFGSMAVGQEVPLTESSGDISVEL